ncbi:MAG: hypothetical protein LBM93_06200, partial [Oscillospiraceae bacterium]|nr:hypothetical protein [Oscillospiraceae bacterium]
MRKFKRITIFITVILTILCNTIGGGAWTMDFPDEWPGSYQKTTFTDSDGNERFMEWGQNYGKQMENPIYVSKAAAAWAGLRSGGINEVMAAAVIGSLTMESGFDPFICGDPYPGNRNGKCDTVLEYDGGTDGDDIGLGLIQWSPPSALFELLNEKLGMGWSLPPSSDADMAVLWEEFMNIPAEDLLLYEAEFLVKDFSDTVHFARHIPKDRDEDGWKCSWYPIIKSYDFYGEEVCEYNITSLANLTVGGDITEQIKLATLAYTGIRLRGNILQSHLYDRARMAMDIYAEFSGSAIDINGSLTDRNGNKIEVFGDIRKLISISDFGVFNSSVGESNIGLKTATDFIFSKGYTANSELQKWKKTIDLEKQNQVNNAVRAVVMLLGILLIIYSVVLYLAYHFDMLNNFVDVEIMPVLTLNRLRG